VEDIVSKLGKIAIIGGGKMGEAILSGLVNGAMFDLDSVHVAEPGEERREFISSTYGVACYEDGSEITHPTTVILAIKPQVLVEVCTQLAATSNFDPKRVISIAAGVTTETLQSLFTDAAIIRVMPNAPLMVGAGMSAVCIASDTPRTEGEIVCELFALMGEAVLLDETKLNAVTAISGSGPAYYALFTEYLIQAGEEIGLEPDDARLLAVQTLVGSARYLELTDASPTDLRVAVTSPKGTTAAALDEFRAQSLDRAVLTAVKAAVRRAEELA